MPLRLFQGTPLHERSGNQPTPDPSQEGNWPAGVAPLLGGAGGGFRGIIRAQHSGKSLPDAVASQTTISEFVVSGMNCNNCARHVAEAIQGVAGVAGADVRLEEGRATVRWRPDALLDAGQIVEAVKKAGYGAVLIPEPSCHSEPSGSS